MKYKNILGKDFNTKKEAKEYFNSQLYSIEQKIRGHRAVDRHTKFTEDTLIKDSEMKYLYDNFLTEDKETLKEVFNESNPHSWWCKFNNNGTRNLGFEIETRLQGIIPVRISRIFTCFGKAIKNHFLHEKQTARRLIHDQRDDYLKKFAGENEYGYKVIWSSIFECDECKCKVAYDDIEVHHLVPFNDIYNEWKENVWKQDPLPNSAGTRFEDFKILEDGSMLRAGDSWCEFHLNISRFQKLCKTCHAKETHG
jgi:hypothetical protein|tara:strand:+ start:43 stop:801 length:759 start_codon:yes stop_codon:yes gene_type:complete